MLCAPLPVTDEEEFEVLDHREVEPDQSAEIALRHAADGARGRHARDRRGVEADEAADDAVHAVGGDLTRREGVADRALQVAGREAAEHRIAAAGHVAGGARIDDHARVSADEAAGRCVRSDSDRAGREAVGDGAVEVVAAGEAARVVEARDIAEREARVDRSLVGSDKSADAVVLGLVRVDHIAGRDGSDDVAQVPADEAAGLVAAAAHVACRDRARNGAGHRVEAREPTREVVGRRDIADSRRRR